MEATTPEELEELLEDALILSDGEMVASLFETHAAIVDAAGTTTRGDRSIGCDRFVRPGGHYCAEPREIVQAADIALVLGPQTIDVLRRGRDARWRFIISFGRENDVRPGRP